MATSLIEELLEGANSAGQGEYRIEPLDSTSLTLGYPKQIGTKVDYTDMINLFTSLEKSESGFVLMDV